MDLSCLQVLDPVKGALGQAVILLVTAIYQNILQFVDKDVYPKNYTKCLLNDPNPTFDFVIVGSNTAGCVLTNRLTESEEFKVLLIEAGGYPTPSSDVPYFFFALDSDTDWGYLSAKEKYACNGMIDGRCTLDRGKVLGGTTTVNNMHYHRGTALEYDCWGLDKWKSREIDKYVVMLEKYVGKTATPFDVGTKGNLTLSYFKSEHFLRQALSKMYEQAGYKQLTRGKLLGYRDMLVTSWKGIRMNMPRVFLGPIKHRPNLHVALSTMATKIHFTDDKRVKTLEVEIGNQKKLIRVRKELILTGGPVHNVQLLQLSGLGPKELLQKHNIPVIADLPIGNNLRMNLRVPLFVAIDKCCGKCLNCTTLDCQNDAFDYHEFNQNTWDYIMDKTGPLTNTGINDFVAFVSTNHRRRDVPNIGINHIYFKRNDIHLKRYLEKRHLHPDTVASVMKFNKARNIVIFFPTLLSTFSHGQVYIKSTDYKEQPEIEPRFLTDEQSIDYRTLYAAVTMIVSLTDSLVMQRYKAKFLNVNIPNCRSFKFCSEHYFRCLITNLGFPSKKMSGVTKMGHRCHNKTVIDEDLKVLKVRGLRISDVSLSPGSTSSNGMANDALFAEILGDKLRKRWSKQYKSLYEKKKTAINVVLD